jgi:heterodisulfide reductase subunit A-like polyferredoxin
MGIEPTNPGNGVRCGEFLCECGDKIAPQVELAALEEMLKTAPQVAGVEVLPFSCLQPGLARIQAAVAAGGLNRLVIAGCERRVLLKKCEQEMEPLGFKEGFVDMVN